MLLELQNNKVGIIGLNNFFMNRIKFGNCIFLVLIILCLIWGLSNLLN
jgi:hypothetical protein